MVRFFMKIEMNDEGGIDILNMDVDQVGLLVRALQASPNQDFMQDQEINRMIKLLSILESEVFDLTSGKIDFSQFNIS